MSLEPNPASASSSDRRPDVVPGDSRANPAVQIRVGHARHEHPDEHDPRLDLLFYVDILGLDVRSYGVVMLVYAVIDAIDNPVLGYLSDRTRSRFGRRKPWLVVGTTVMAAAFVGFFAAPSHLEGLQLVAWFTVFALLCEAADSMISANYGSLLPELFTTERPRAIANSLRQGMQLIAMILALAVTPLLTTKVFGTETSTRGFTITALIYAAIALIALFVMVFSIRENPRYETEEQPKFFASIKDIITTKLFWTIGIASACYLIPLAMVLAGLQLYVKYTLKLPIAQSLIIQGIVIVVAAVFLVLWTRLIRRRRSGVSGSEPMVWLERGSAGEFRGHSHRSDSGLSAWNRSRSLAGRPGLASAAGRGAAGRGRGADSRHPPGRS